MKNPFKMITLTITGCCLLAGAAAPVSYAGNLQQTAASATVTPAPVPAALSPQSGIQVTGKPVKEQTTQLQADLLIPVINGMKDAKYQAQLNDIIERHAMEDLDILKKQAQKDEAAAKESGYEWRPYSLNISFEVKAAGGAANNNIVSLKIVTYTYTGGAHGMPRVDTYTVSDEAEAKRVELKDLFGDGYKDTINEHIRQEIAVRPDDFFKDGFTGISDTQPFYVEKGEAIILFSVYEIAPYAAGIPEFRIALPKDTNETAASRLVVGDTELFSSEAAIYINDSGTTLLPLRIIAERLGYKVNWNEEKKSVEVTKGAQWTSLQTGKDTYIYNKTAPFPLGQAPVIKEDGLMYVPIDFFIKVLQADVNTEAGTIQIKNKSHNRGHELQARARPHRPGKVETFPGKSKAEQRWHS